MTPETEIDSSVAGINDRDGSNTAITYNYDTTSKSRARNGD